MNEPQMTKEQEAKLDEAARYAELFEQQAREMGEAFTQKWEKRLSEAKDTVVLNSVDR